MTRCPFSALRDAQVHLSVSQVSVSLSVDCQHVGERPARPLGNLPTEGFEMLGKLVKTRGPSSGSASVTALRAICSTSCRRTTRRVLTAALCLCPQFGLQSFEIVCNTTWASEDTCCDLPGLVSRSTLAFSDFFLRCASCFSVCLSVGWWLVAEWET